MDVVRLFGKGSFLTSLAQVNDYKKYGNKVLAMYCICSANRLSQNLLLHGLHLSLCSANCHNIDINPTLLQGVAKKIIMAAAMRVVG